MAGERRSCGECLMNDARVIRLDANGVCPNCGTDYGRAPIEPHQRTEEQARDWHIRRDERNGRHTP